MNFFFLFGSLEHVSEVGVKVLLTARDRSRKRKNLNEDVISFSLVTHLLHLQADSYYANGNSLSIR